VRLVLLALVCPVLTLCAQEFEAASVTVSKAVDDKSSGSFLPAGEFVSRNTDLKSLIVLAYHVPPDRVSGQPAWMETARYDVSAKAAPQTKLADLRVMLQHLLTDRFKLEVHREEKVVSGYALTVSGQGSKQGSKLKPSEDGQMNCGPKPSKNGLLHFECSHVDTASIPDVLVGVSAGYLAETTVVDETGLKGSWEFTMEWTPYWEYVKATTPGVSLFEAVEKQLGLKLEAKKVSATVVVIDKVNRDPVEK
jgi:uncharacterized protein (TIGR03435 family)